MHCRTEPCELNVLRVCSVFSNRKTNQPSKGYVEKTRNYRNVKKRLRAVKSATGELVG